MEAEAPIGQAGRQANHLAVLLNDALRVWTGEEVEVKCPSDEAELYQGLVGRRWCCKNDIRPSGAERDELGDCSGVNREVSGTPGEKHSMRLESTGRWDKAVFKIHRMRAVTTIRWRIRTSGNGDGLKFTDMFSSRGSAASLFHIVCTVPLRTSRRNPLEATTSPNPYMLVSNGRAEVSYRSRDNHVTN